MSKGVTNSVSTIMLTLGVVALISVAYAWQNGIISGIVSKGVYADFGNICTNPCFVDSGNVANVFVPLGSSTIVNTRIINGGAVDKTYVIKYYPNFTSEISMVAATPTVFVPHESAASASISLTGLIAKNREIDFNITAINVANGADIASFRIKSVIDTSNVSSFGFIWFMAALLSSAFFVYMRAK